MDLSAEDAAAERAREVEVERAREAARLRAVEEERRRCGKRALKLPKEPCKRALLLRKRALLLSKRALLLRSWGGDPRQKRPSTMQHCIRDW